MGHPGMKRLFERFPRKQIISNHRFQNLLKQKYHLSGALKLLWYSFHTAHMRCFLVQHLVQRVCPQCVDGPVIL